MRTMVNYQTAVASNLVITLIASHTIMQVVSTALIVSFWNACSYSRYWNCRSWRFLMPVQISRGIHFFRLKSFAIWLKTFLANSTSFYIFWPNRKQRITPYISRPTRINVIFFSTAPIGRLWYRPLVLLTSFSRYSFQSGCCTGYKHLFEVGYVHSITIIHTR